MRKRYKTDLTDKQWALIAPHIPPAKEGGRPRDTDMREVVNACIYIGRTGCQWSMIPSDFPPKSTVFEYYSQWATDGTLDEIVRVLRPGARQTVTTGEVECYFR